MNRSLEFKRRKILTGIGIRFPLVPKTNRLAIRENKIKRNENERQGYTKLHIIVQGRGN